MIPAHLGAGAALGALLIVVCCIGRVIYNLYFHPLASYPGPLLNRATRLVYCYRLVTGRLSLDVRDYHERYGPVVRIAPNELSFACAAAWKDIYGHRIGPHGTTSELPKNPDFYLLKGQEPGILATNRENHAMLRRQLAHGFSDRGLRAQESLIGAYVDLLIQRLRERAVRKPGTDARFVRGQVKDGKDEEMGSDAPLLSGLAGSDAPAPPRFDMTQWYNWTTFDIIGDLAFGEPFGCLENATYHPWVLTVNNTMLRMASQNAVKYMGLGWLIPLLLKFVITSRREHIARTDEKLKRRMQLSFERPDLIEGLLKKKDEMNLSWSRLRTTASSLIIAGSETTATLLSGATYLLCSHPEVLRRVTDEVRSTFASEQEITLTSVGNLPYMLACLNEAMRRYPPVPIGTPRVVPAAGMQIAGYDVPEKTVVAVWQYAAYHSTQNFREPFEYRPERFLHDPKYENDKIEVLQPFSVGPRNCLGRNLAYSEMRLILARLLFNFDIELADKNSQWLNQNAYIIWKKPPLEVYLHPRKVE
ncbi:hypothetical protein VTK73DRAFT_8826 [Phialemonium thermophilum]|uniref:Cytochrome P450 n=1 Tax=Phialemonium thermophilum TaxID=223376 RepID=A0ABR3W5Z4_9PEZI